MLGSARRCGRPLRAVDDERRVVTVLFADLVGLHRRCPSGSTRSGSRTWSTGASTAWPTTSPASAARSTRSSATPSSPCSAPPPPTRTTPSGPSAPPCACRPRCCEEAEPRSARTSRSGSASTPARCWWGPCGPPGRSPPWATWSTPPAASRPHAQPGEVLVGPATHAATQPHHRLRGPRPAGRQGPRGAGRDLAGRRRPRCRPATGPAASTCRWSAGTHEVGLLHHARSTRSIRHDRAAAGAARGRRRHGQEPPGRRGRRVRPRRPTAPSSARAGACPTARPTCGGRWPTPCATGLEVADGDGARPRPASHGPAPQVAERHGPPHRRPRGAAHRRGPAHAARLRRAARRRPDHRPPGGRAGRSASTSAPRPAAARWCCRSPTCTGPTTPCCTLIDDVFATIHHCPVVVSPRPARRCSTSGRPGPAGTTRSCCTSTRWAAQAAGELLEHLVGEPVPDAVRRRPARPQRRQPVLPRGAGQPARRRRRSAEPGRRRRAARHAAGPGGRPPRRPDAAACARCSRTRR